jgi:hypothetical protein
MDHVPILRQIGRRGTALPPLPVIPAKAGIHGADALPVARWIPAFGPVIFSLRLGFCFPVGLVDDSMLVLGGRHR